MTTVSAVVDAVRAALGDEVLGVDPGFGPVAVDVAPPAWAAALQAARDAGASYADMLTGYDDRPRGVAVVAHVSTPDAADHVLIRTRVPADDPVLPTAVGVFRGLAWHERETAEMLGVRFEGHATEPLLLPPGFEGHPLRKDFSLTPRVETAWPGAKDPGDDAGARRPRRRQLPPGVVEEWLPEEGS